MPFANRTNNKPSAKLETKYQYKHNPESWTNYNLVEWGLYVLHDDVGCALAAEVLEGEPPPPEELELQLAKLMLRSVFPAVI